MITEPSKPKLSVTEITTKYLPFDKDVEIYASAGLDAMSIWWDKLKNYGVAKGNRLIRDAGLPIASMVGVEYLLSSQAGEIRDTFDDILVGLDACAKIGIPVLGIVPGNKLGRSQDEMEALTINTILRLAPEARSRGVTLALEPIHAPYFDFLNTLIEADRIVNAVGQSNVGIMFDVWHLCHEPELHKRIEATANNIAFVHFSDWREPTRYHDDRLLTGQGVLPLKTILQKIHTSGYRGYYDVEIFSEDVWRGDAAENLKYCRQYFNSIWVAEN